MSSTAQVWAELTAHQTQVAILGGCQAAVAWDQQVNLPLQGAGARSEHLAMLTRMTHDLAVDPRVGSWLDALEGAPDLDPVQLAGVRNLRRDYDLHSRVPSDLVARMGKAASDGFQAWGAARDAGDFDLFAPHLSTLVELARERAAAIDSSADPYDVLLDEYEPGWTSARLGDLFGRLSAGLQELVQAVADRPQPARVDATFPVAQQLPLHRRVAGALGYDLTAGRVDFAEHPFTISLGKGDTRITTHLYDADLLAGLGGTVHETGHALYEQGLPRHLRGTGVEGPASMGLHESQSRLWENFIGRSRPFFAWFEKQLRADFPGTGVTAEQMYRSANRIEPGLIRVRADEVTYNLHILMRFELESALVRGTLAVRDLPEAWSARIRELLGVSPESARDGVLQDVHWSSGAFGYFPSYTLGNLYAASLSQALLQQLPDLWGLVERGEFAPILAWLREHVHRHGHMKESAELVHDAAGERDHVEDLLAYLWGRHGALQGVHRPS